MDNTVKLQISKDWLHGLAYGKLSFNSTLQTFHSVVSAIAFKVHFKGR